MMSYAAHYGGETVEAGGQGMTYSGDAGDAASVRSRREDVVEGKLFIGGLSYDTNADILHDYGSQWGPLQDSFVMERKGYGFLTFVNVDDAFRFLEYKPHQVGGRSIEVKAAVPRSRGGSSRAGSKLFVGGVPREVGTEEFREHFEAYGEVEDAAIVLDGNGASRGFGFVTYTETLATEKALVVKHVIRERVVDCKRAVPREDVGPGGGFGGRGGRGGGHAGGRGAYGGHGYAHHGAVSAGIYGSYGVAGGYAAFAGYGATGGYGGGYSGYGGAAGGGGYGVGHGAHGAYANGQQGYGSYGRAQWHGSSGGVGYGSSSGGHDYGSRMGDHGRTGGRYYNAGGYRSGRGAGGHADPY